MSQPPPTPIVVAAAAAGAILLGILVFRPGRGTQVREWTPGDHDQPAGAQAAPTTRPRDRQPKTTEPANLAELAWAKNCATCHGKTGRGDGPQGPMVKAPDLTRAEWQGSVTDEEILRTIRQGRNSMPPFDLPPAVLQGLVQRIRANRAPR